MFRTWYGQGQKPRRTSSQNHSLREFCPNTADLALVPKLTKETGRAADYINGTVVAKVYDPDQMPSEEDLRGDLDRFLGFADAAYESGLRFHESMEPTHLVYPWVEDLSGPGIVKTRKAIADEKGAVWWVTNTRIAPQRSSNSVSNSQRKSTRTSTCTPLATLGEHDSGPHYIKE